jgi:hypothetical protein
VGEKTPYHLWHVPLLLEWYPEARVIGIVRDGRDVVRSILKAPWTAQRRLRPHCLKWIRCAHAAEKFAAQYPGRFKLLRFEDLLTHAEKELRAVDAFLGLDFEPSQLVADNKTDVIPSWESGWKAKAVEAPDVSRIGAWKKSVSEKDRRIMNLMMGKDLERLGYGDTDVAACSGIRVGWERFLNGLCRMGFYRLWYNLVGRYTPAARAHRRTGGNAAMAKNKTEPVA